MDTRRALIVGGGPAGLTSAIALRQAGWSCEIVELTREWRPTGVGIALQSPPLRALKTLGLFDDLVAIARVHHKLEIRAADGRKLAEIPNPNVNDPGDPPFVNLSRIALHEFLLDAIERRGVTVRLGTTVETLRDTGAQVEVTLSDGSVAEYQLVIGADGVNSRVRELILPDAPAPEDAGQAIWRMGARCPVGLDVYTIMVAGPHRIGLVPLPGDDLYLWMLDSTLGPERPPRERLLELFLERMSAYGGFAAEIARQATDPAQLDFRALKWLLVDPPWHAGRVILIGDAVHTTTPQLAFGAGLAIEDAVVLRDLLLAGVAPEMLGERFAKRRYERAAVVVRNSLQLSRWEQQGGPPNPKAPELTAASFAKLAEAI